ncbi:ATP-grasp domain-containing protein [Streptomyces luteosporeus]
MMPTDYLTLTPQPSTTAQLLATEARRRGMPVRTLPKPAPTDGRPGAHYFGGPKLAARIRDALGIALLEPADDWLTTLPYAYVRRRITSSTLAEAGRLPGRTFVKPPSDKSFPAAVYEDGTHLARTCPDLSPKTLVQVSDVVTWKREFRLYILDGECRTGSQCATFGRLDAAPLSGHPDEAAVLDFARTVLSTHAHTLPSAVVLDVGLLADGWAVVEANLPWFTNCYAASPDRALDVVLRAAGPRTRLTARDTPFCRHLTRPTP